MSMCYTHTHTHTEREREISLWIQSDCQACQSELCKVESLFQQISFGQWLILFMKTWHYILKICIACHCLISVCLCTRWSHFLFSRNSLRLSYRSALTKTNYRVLSFHSHQKIKGERKQHTDARAQLISQSNTFLTIYLIYTTRNVYS